ncbi:hypothetical protein BD289DRAFT_130409 [Coniella lustricola]|uniref:Uncharacterized protein n=1 Tax=Coniella lustricola TaxID=2025994 RepID=A0A2T3AFQ9_9PEZI|nr:hypothetical protein BD289DRAFT_130409 [Coniella lustricola]
MPPSDETIDLALIDPKRNRKKEQPPMAYRCNRNLGSAGFRCGLLSQPWRLLIFRLFFFLSRVVVVATAGASDDLQGSSEAPLRVERNQFQPHLTSNNSTSQLLWSLEVVLILDLESPSAFLLAPLCYGMIDHAFIRPVAECDTCAHRILLPVASRTIPPQKPLSALDMPILVSLFSARNEYRHQCDT